MGHEYLKRGKGKKTGDIKKYDFFSHYRKNAELEKFDRKTYSAFLKELLSAYSEAIVKENMELNLGPLGRLRIKSRKMEMFNKNGEFHKGLKVDWNASWEYWEIKYPNLSRDEIVAIKDKTVIFHENEHTSNEIYTHLWDKTTAIVKFQRFYTFSASRQYRRLINEVVNDPDRKVFYYG